MICNLHALSSRTLTCALWHAQTTDVSVLSLKGTGTIRLTIHTTCEKARREEYVADTTHNASQLPRNQTTHVHSWVYIFYIYIYEYVNMSIYIQYRI